MTINFGIGTVSPIRRLHFWQEMLRRAHDCWTSCIRAVKGRTMTTVLDTSNSAGTWYSKLLPPAVGRTTKRRCCRFMRRMISNARR
jgi:hypothetical protein